MRIKKLYADLFRDLKQILRENHIIIFAVIGVFIVGFTFTFTLPNETKRIVIEGLFEKFSRFDQVNKLVEARQIFLNNLFVSSLEMFLGFTILVPLGLILINGLAIGITIDLFTKVASTNPQSLLVLIAALLPHGIIEIPMVFLAAVLGITIIIRRRREIFFSTIKIFFLIIIPLLIVAALLEVYVTPWIVEVINPQIRTEKSIESLYK